MSVTIRKAVAADQKAISAIVRQVHINPTGLDWRRFVVADEDGRVVATGQIRPHWDGSRELASIATVPDRQKTGLARRVINTLLAQERGDVFLVCRAALEGFYARFGFHTARREELPAMFRMMHPLMGLWNGRIMKRTCSKPNPRAVEHATGNPSHDDER